MSLQRHDRQQMKEQMHRNKQAPQWLQPRPLSQKEREWAAEEEAYLKAVLKERAEKRKYLAQFK